MDIKIIKSIDCTNSPDLKKRIQFYQSRFMFLYKRIEKSIKARGLELSYFVERGDKEEFTIIVRVNEIRQNKTFITIICEELYKGTSHVFPVYAKTDQENTNLLFVGITIGLIIKCYKERYYIDEIIWANETTKHYIPKHYTVAKYICAISDVHVGANNFREDKFENFIKYVNDTASIKYLVVAGDICEGVAVYSEQNGSLSLAHGTMDEQVLSMNAIFSKFRKDLNIILSPGNHDSGVGLAEPQPNPYSNVKFNHPHITCVTNPAFLQIEGLDYLVYHGRALSAYIRDIELFTTENTVDICEYLVKVGHIASMLDVMNVARITNMDYMHIESRPHIFHVGHTHIANVKHSKGTTYVNGGTFQDITPYQQSMGIAPTVGTAVLINIDNIKENEILYF
jgi:DNA polymerase II small subunit